MGKFVQNYNDCMIKKVEEIAWLFYRLKFSDLPKFVQRVVEEEASVICSHNLADNLPHVWRNKKY